METYSIINDFSNISPNISQLQEEIINNINITTSVEYINLTGDVMDIFFATNISAPEKIILDLLVASHVPVFIPSTRNSLNIVPRKNNFNKSSYKRLSSNVFPGTSYASAKCVSYMSNSSSSYSIEIFDKDNHQILLEKTFTNTEESIQDLGVLTNLPSDTTQLEISGKVTGGGKAYLESVIICYN